MSRRVGFGEGEEDPSGKPRPGPRGAGLRVMAAIVVSLGVGVWIVAGLGGPDDFLESFQSVARGERPLADILSVLLPAIFVEAAAMILLLRGLRVSQPRIPELDPDAGSAQKPMREPVEHYGTAPTPQPTRRQKLDQKINEKLPTGAARVFSGIFLLVWLIGWSTGIMFAFGALISEWGTGESLFLIVWLSFAVIGWFFAVGFLIKLIRGR